MLAPSTRIGFVHDGSLSSEQESALSWLRREDAVVDAVDIQELPTDAPEFDVIWWHRAEPVSACEGVPELAAAVDAHLAADGGLVLSLGAMAAVDDLGIDPVPPDAVMVDSVAAPTGVLWRSLYADHPAIEGLHGQRAHVCDRGAVATARYERVLPARGEVLASTVRGEHDVPDEMTVVSWDTNPGSVLGVAAPLAFDESVPHDVAENRNALAAGCLAAVASDAPQPSRPKSADDLRAMRATFDDDPHRPTYHVTPPANWLNDPNGLIEHDGEYHVFYQYNPAGPFHNTIHWGHAVSDDLLHWRDEPVALAPSPDGPDRDGCWSGCAVDDDGTPTVLYTGGRGREQLPCLATTDDPGLRTWTKHLDNPVIEEPPDDLDLLETEHWSAEFRDHGVWRRDDTWFQVIGTGVVDRGGAVLLYTSTNLRDWEYEGPLLVGDDGHGTVWECPELLDYGDSQLLHVSNYDDVVYFLGGLSEGRFEVDHEGVLDAGDFYAPQSLYDDANDRYLMWGWLPETRDVSAQWDAGWSGALSLPRVVSIGADGRVRQRPAEEVTALRETAVLDEEPGRLDADSRYAIDASGQALEVELSVALEDATAFELSVFESADGAERTVVRYTNDNELVVDRSASNRHDAGTRESQRLTVTPYDEPLSLRAFLDGSVLELYANERHCLTSRVYPSAESTGLSMAVAEGRATVDSLSVWALEPTMDDVEE